MSNRRQFLKGATAAVMAGATGLTGCLLAPRAGKGRTVPKRSFQISLAAWSLHRAIRGPEQLKMLDVPQMLREEFAIDGLEFVSTLFEVPTARYVSKLRKRCGEFNITPVLIMCDGDGSLAHPDQGKRKRAVRDHHKWVYIASDLDCHAIRVNWHGSVDEDFKDEQAIGAMIDRSAETFTKLIELGRRDGVDIIIENHGGPSSNPDLLVRLMKTVDSPHLGTLPDFGNFPGEVDRYRATDAMMPYAKAVSAKCYDFDQAGNETKIDFERMIKIVVDRHGYHGWIGIEYEGKRMSEPDGIRAARDLLIRLRG